MSLLPSNVKYQLSDIGLCNQLSTKHKRCIFKQSCSFAGNILERIALANRNALWQWVNLLGNIRNTAFFFIKETGCFVGFLHPPKENLPIQKSYTNE